MNWNWMRSGVWSPLTHAKTQRYGARARLHKTHSHAQRLLTPRCVRLFLAPPTGGTWTRTRHLSIRRDALFSLVGRPMTKCHWTTRVPPCVTCAQQHSDTRRRMPIQFSLYKTQLPCNLPADDKLERDIVLFLRYCSGEKLWFVNCVTLYTVTSDNDDGEDVSLQWQDVYLAAEKGECCQRRIKHFYLNFFQIFALCNS